MGALVAAATIGNGVVYETPFWLPSRGVPFAWTVNWWWRGWTLLASTVEHSSSTWRSVPCPAPTATRRPSWWITSTQRRMEAPMRW